jgi:outer membrane lipoprotein SlyB
MKTLFILLAILSVGCSRQMGYQPVVDSYQSYPQQPQGYPQGLNYQPQRYPNGYSSYPHEPPVQYRQQQQYYPQQEDTAGRLQRDRYECEQLANQASSQVRDTATYGLGGAIAGAAGGAIIGAITGDAGKGAAIGAGAGVLGGAYGMYKSDADYQRAIRTCLRNRGHRVVE